MHKLCPSCGADSREKKFAGAFCQSCIIKKIPLECPPKVSLTQCHSCKRVRLKGEWASAGRGALESFLAGKCKTSAEVVSSRSPSSLDGGPAELLFVLKHGTSLVELSRVVELEFALTMCPDCSRKSGGYYEAILQLRGDSERVEQAFRKITRVLERKTFVSKIVDTKDGPDLYVGSSKKAQEIISGLGFSFSTSLKLSGVRDGKRIYRATYCVRL